MTEFSYEVKDPIGLHARPAGLLVKEAEKYSSEITLIKDGKEANCRKLFALMGLAVKCDDKITVKIEGSDEAEAKKGMEEFFNNNL